MTGEGKGCQDVLDFSACSVTISKSYSAQLPPPPFSG